MPEHDHTDEETQLAEDQAQRSGGMTREQQTIWIVGAILLIGLTILYNVTRLPDGHPFKECERIIGMDRACEARIAAHAVKWGFYPRPR